MHEVLPLVHYGIRGRWLLLITTGEWTRLREYVERSTVLLDFPLIGRTTRVGERRSAAGQGGLHRTHAGQVCWSHQASVHNNTAVAVSKRCGVDVEGNDSPQTNRMVT